MAIPNEESGVRAFVCLSELGPGAWDFGIGTRSVNAFHNRFLESREGADVAHPVPRVLRGRALALAFVTFEEAGHEELLRERRQADAPGRAVIHHPCRVVGIH